MPAFMNTFVTALGWAGAVGGVCAYAMVTRGKWAPNSAQFQLTNLVAAVFLGLVAARSGAWPSVASNLVWFSVGIYAIAMLVRARRRTIAEHDAALATGTGDTSAVVPTIEENTTGRVSAYRAGNRTPAGHQAAEPLHAGTDAANDRPAHSEHSGPANPRVHSLSPRRAAALVDNLMGDVDHEPCCNRHLAALAGV